MVTMPTFLVEVDFANNGTWTTLADTKVRSFTTKRGSTRVHGPAVKYEGGQSAIVLDNRTRDFDPENLSGPYVSGGATQVVPGRPIRIRNTWSATTYDIWRGFVDAWDISYDKGNTDSTCTVRATDAKKILSRFVGTAGAAVGAGEDTGARIARILNNANWPAALRELATGNTTLQATTLAGNAWELIQLAADSENGAVFINGAGKVKFVNRRALINGTSVATFGDDGTGSELPYVDLGLEYDEETILNLFRVTRVGGSTQTQQDTTSQSTYGAGVPFTYERSDLLMQTDDEANNWAGWGLYQSKNAELRFDQIGINAQRDTTNLFPQVLGREIGDRITIKRRPPGGGSVISKDVFIRGIQHMVTRTTWRTVYTLQSAAKYAFFVLDDPVLGVLDANALAY